MKVEFAALSSVSLESGVNFERPPQLPELVHLNSPAIEVMTDFHLVRPVTVEPQLCIDEALEKMKTSGVRLLLVTDDSEEVIGLITAKDIQGERPIKIVQETRVSRSQITVKMIMTPQSATTALNLVSVRNAQVGHVVETLRQLERQHILVVDIDENLKQQRICGLFSTSQIRKQLDVELSEDVAPAHSLAEIQHELG